MMPGGQKKTGGAGAYLSRCLQMNPIYQADEVIALRSRVLRLVDDSPSPPKEDGLAERRAEALREIDAIRGECWSASPEVLFKKIDRLKLDGMPDLQAAAHRLKVVCQTRPRLPSLTGHKDFDGEFLQCLKEVLAGSARETAVLREQVVSAFRSGRLSKRGKRMIRLIQRELPDLYALEADWLASLTRQSIKGSKVVATSDSSSPVSVGSQEEGSRTSWFLVIMIIVVIRILIGVMRD